MQFLYYYQGEMCRRHRTITMSTQYYTVLNGFIINIKRPLARCRLEIGFEPPILGTVHRLRTPEMQRFGILNQTRVVGALRAPPRSLRLPGKMHTFKGHTFKVQKISIYRFSMQW